MKYKTPFHRIFYASLYSIKGLYSAIKNEQSFRYEFITFIILCIIIALIDIKNEWRIALIGSWLAVMSFELLNSAVEKAFDLIDINFRKEIEAGKNMLSGAIFIIILFNIILWLVLIIKIISKHFL